MIEHPSDTTIITYSLSDLAKLSHIKVSRLKRWMRLYGFPRRNPQGGYNAQELKLLLDVKLKLSHTVKPKQAIAQTLDGLPYYHQCIEQAMHGGYLQKAQALFAEAAQVLTFEDIRLLAGYIFNRSMQIGLSVETKPNAV